LGKVRPEHVKRISRELLDKFPDKFSVNFENNKKAVEALTNVSPTKLGNRIAGYIIRLLATLGKEAT